MKESLMMITINSHPGEVAKIVVCGEESNVATQQAM
ncbi:hypothetical protein CCACVL1_27345 [Corchorus capsularis]|uniref:Uncharacterized protein n=1 Tax=Corchorus capsularis TaxID=210143 RepID=A0A1R3GB03_COCAP|nr:hypothetical protein CCACVL1_27345 [Corchorus capsularis]